LKILASVVTPVVRTVRAARAVRAARVILPAVVVGGIWLRMTLLAERVVERVVVLAAGLHFLNQFLSAKR
jgi:hypothetical protein